MPPLTRTASLFHAALDIATYHISHKGKLRAHTTRRSMSLCDANIMICRSFIIPQILFRVNHRNMSIKLFILS